MELEINDIQNFDNLDVLTKTKMMFIFNSLENGWKIKKINDKYIFSKKHENKKEVLLDNYLNNFIKENLK